MKKCDFRIGCGVVGEKAANLPAPMGRINDMKRHQSGHAKLDTEIKVLLIWRKAVAKSLVNLFF